MAMLRREFVRSASLVVASGLVGRAADSAGSPRVGVSTPGFLERVKLHNVESVIAAEDGDGWRLCRVPASLSEKLNANARKRAYSTAGCEIRFNLVGDEARILLKFVETRGGSSTLLAVLAGVWHGDYQMGTIVVRDTWTEIVVKRPSVDLGLVRGEGRTFDPALVRVQLPLLPEVRIKSITGDISPPRPNQIPARRYLAYGSSITNGFVASEPSAAYPARLSRLLGVDAINLGLGGGAHLEPEMADYIAGRGDWDFASLELGINLVGGQMPVPEFRGRVVEFLRRIIERRADKWIFCTDLFTCIHDFRGNPRITEFRNVVREAVAASGAPRLVHLDGRKLLSNPRGLSDDLLHPVADGFAEIAVNFAAEMKRSIG